jgi:hypothetical protein
MDAQAGPARNVHRGNPATLFMHASGNANPLDRKLVSFETNFAARRPPGGIA